MESPPDSTITPSTLTSSMPSTELSTTQSASVATVTSPSASVTLTSKAQSDFPSTIQSSSLSPERPAFPSNVQLTPTSPSNTTPSSESPITPDGSVTSAMDASNVPFNFSSQLPKNPEQLKFHIGESSKSPNKLYYRPPSSVTITPVPSSKPGNSTGLFGSEVVSQVSRAPGRFKFRTPSAAPEDGRKLARRRDSASPPARPVARTHQPAGPRGSMPYIPMLGPDIVIRPVSLNQRNTHERNSTQNSQPHPRLNDSEIFQLLAGYRSLKDEVASLKAQMINSQTLMEEILNGFSSEVAKINTRLTALEQGKTGRDQGLTGHEQEETSHDQGKTDYDQRIDHCQIGSEQQTSEDKTGDRESEVQERLNAELENLTLTKDEEINK